jgi:manganese/zinc/iron transport system permease protein
MGMTWYALDTWIVATGVLAAVACALPGSFLMLRQMSMMGDAISHAVLPGLALAFIITGTRASLEMFIGAAVIGVLTAVFTQWISSWGRVDRGAAMGIVFTTLFAIGLILITRATHHVDLDPSCVLFGSIELTPLDVAFDWTIAGVALEVPRAFVVLALVASFNLVLVILFFREFQITSFDPALASSLGIHPGFYHYLLMVMVAITTVAAFEAVGSILVIALLIVPPATAYLLCNRLPLMLLVSGLVGAASAVLGHVVAIGLPLVAPVPESSTSGMMAVVSGVLFLLAALLSPGQGLCWRLLRRRALEAPDG